MNSEKIAVVTNDGKNYIGVLRGLDKSTNVVLERCSERVFAEDEGCEEIEMGVFIIRGDNIAVVGEFDPELDSKLDVASIQAPPLKPIVH